MNFYKYEFYIFFHRSIVSLWSEYSQSLCEPIRIRAFKIRKEKRKKEKQQTSNKKRSVPEAKQNRKAKAKLGEQRGSPYFPISLFRSLLPLGKSKETQEKNEKGRREQQWSRCGIQFQVSAELLGGYGGFHRGCGLPVWPTWCLSHHACI